ncbi:MAG: PSD1 and planctomycete cytochrome C domain-containing protein [Gemmataceae bacterium]|nr:PSD1 and planctomycete cytochrome C domain-containing protein [Gemmataceae bacterium]
MTARLFPLAAGLLLATTPARADDFFESKVRPVLAEHCVKCHGPDKQKAGIRLDTPDHLAAAPDGSGPLVVPGKPDDSRLLKTVRHDGEVKMPPAGKLADPVIQALAEWVQGGAKWPAAAAARPDAAATHWAFQPVHKPDVPEGKNPIDHLIRAKLEAKGLTPSPAADKRTLLRRVYFDLTGLPPAAEEADAFEKDDSPEAFEKVVDKLLASPAFGERWGRHWLDVARYSDTRGAIFNQDGRYPSAWTYRDWVVKAFNDDLPYDQFLVRQVAADQLTRVEGHPDLAALGLLTLGRKFEESEPDIIDDRLDVLFRGVQGLTVGCARCHDHKYDPVPIKDYYSLYGVFAGAKEVEVPIVATAADRLKAQAFAAEHRARVRSFEKYVEAERKRVLGPYRQQADRYLLAAHAGGGEPKEGTAREDGLNQVVVNRFAETLNGTKDNWHPVLGPWHAFAAVPAEKFAKEAKKLAKQFADNDDEEKPVHPLVARLFAGKPPADLGDVAGRYGKLFGGVAKKWERKQAEADRTDTARPTQLDDEAEEDVRQLVAAGGSFDFSADDLRNHFGPEEQAKYEELKARISDWATGPDAPPLARVVEDPEEPGPQPVFVGGNPEKPGDEVPRQFLAVLSKDRKPFTAGVARLELARAIASKDNPLTARVWANRVWGHLFGRGLVETASDFGTRAAPPTHPELLDGLAHSLAENGWSTKKLIRQIILSETYRQVSDDRADARAVDPGNTLVWRAARKRLQLEPFRDALLAASGNLDRAVGGRPVDPDEQPLSTRRTPYLAVDRGNLPAVFRSFDFANPDLHAPARHETEVPQQALFLLNSPFVIEQARGLAKRAGDGADGAWVKAAYRAALARDPSAEEVESAVKFLASATTQPPAEGAPPPLSARERFAQVLLMSNEFLYVD